MALRVGWDRWISGLQARFGRRRVIALGLLLIAGLASIAIQLLNRTDNDHSAMMYLAVPYGVAVFITLLRPYQDADKWWQKYLSHSISSLVVFLASSVVLFEGFICVLFFMPIYYLVVTLAFFGHWASVSHAKRKGKTYATALPVLVAVFSLEGTFPATTLDRHNTVFATTTTTLSPQAVRDNLAPPFDIAQSNDWMLGLFPMPVAVEAGSLGVGETHRAVTRYHRWFFTNTHEGEIVLRIDSVTPERVTATFVKDTSYFSSYVKLIGSDIRIAAEPDGTTRVSLLIDFERRLDPAWYFQPIQRYAMQTMAAHLVEEVMIRDE